MNKRKHSGMGILCLCLLLVTGILSPGMEETVKAAQNITLNGKNVSSVILHVSDAGTFSLSKTDSSASYYQYVDRISKLTYASSNSSVMTVDHSGKYKAVALGSVSLSIMGYDSNGGYLFYTCYQIKVSPDLSGISLAKNKATLYKYQNDLTVPSADIKINSSYVLSTEDENLSFGCQSSNNAMIVEYAVANNVLTLSCATEGKTTVTLTICDQVLTIDIEVVEVGMSTTSALVVKGKTKQLKAKGISEPVTWTSSNKKVASVSSKGVVKAKKMGNTIITATIGEDKLGCVISVVTSKRKRAINKGINIGDTCTYSQAKRMEAGYYDCSSLVWRAYSPNGCNFGSSSYAPPAASIAQWLVGKGKKLSGGLSTKNLTGLKINAGDLYFETGANNGRYKGIYHVEMFAGYCFLGFDSKGDAIVGSKWANRPDNAYWAKGIIGTP